jgi:hypothetical protein
LDPFEKREGINHLAKGESAIKIGDDGPGSKSEYQGNAETKTIFEMTDSISIASTNATKHPGYQQPILSLDSEVQTEPFRLIHHLKMKSHN